MSSKHMAGGWEELQARTWPEDEHDAGWTKAVKIREYKRKKERKKTTLHAVSCKFKATWALLSNDSLLQTTFRTCNHAPATGDSSEFQTKFQRRDTAATRAASAIGRRLKMSRKISEGCWCNHLLHCRNGMAQRVCASLGAGVDGEGRQRRFPHS